MAIWKTEVIPSVLLHHHPRSYHSLSLGLVSLRFTRHKVGAGQAGRDFDPNLYMMHLQGCHDPATVA